MKYLVPSMQTLLIIKSICGISSINGEDFNELRKLYIYFPFYQYICSFLDNNISTNTLDMPMKYQIHTLRKK